MYWFYGRSHEDNNGGRLKARRIQKIFYGFLCVASVVIAAKYSVRDVTTVFFLVCAVISFAGFVRNAEISKGIDENTVNKGEDAGGKEASKGKGYIIATWIIATWFSFALFGRAIFMQEARTTVDLIKLIHFVLLTLAFYPLTPGIAEWMGRIRRKPLCTCDSRKSNMKAAVICGLLFFAIDTVLSFGYYPCTMTSDSVSHWQQAAGLKAMTDYSPMAFNLLLKALFMIVKFKSPYIYILFQIGILAITVGDIAYYLHRKGIRIKALVIGTTVFALLPSTYLLVLYLSKNPITAVLALAVTISLTEVIADRKFYLYRPLWYIKTVLAVAGLYLVRENNIAITIPLIAFSIWLFLSDRANGKKFLIVIGGVICAIGFMQGVVYKSVEYEHVEKSHETIRPLLAPVGSAIQQGIELPEDIMAEAEIVLPHKEWAGRYDPFSSDPLTWGEPRPQYSALSTMEGLRLYLKMLVHYPDVVIRDRLDGMNLIWNIRASLWRSPSGVEGDVSFKDLKLTGPVVASIKSFETSLFKISAKEPVLDVFIWKNGIYVYLLAVTALFLHKKRRFSLMWAALPSVFILLTYVLVIAWQMYFYIWFFPLTVSLLMIVAVVECGN